MRGIYTKPTLTELHSKQRFARCQCPGWYNNINNNNGGMCQRKDGAESVLEHFTQVATFNLAKCLVHEANEMNIKKEEYAKNQG